MKLIQAINKINAAIMPNRRTDSIRPPDGFPFSNLEYKCQCLSGKRKCVQTSLRFVLRLTISLILLLKTPASVPGFNSTKVETLLLSQLSSFQPNFTK